MPNREHSPKRRTRSHGACAENLERRKRSSSSTTRRTIVTDANPIPSPKSSAPRTSKRQSGERKRRESGSMGLRQSRARSVSRQSTTYRQLPSFYGSRGIRKG